MPLTDLQLIAHNISDAGTDVTVRTVTKDSFSDYGDATESTSDETSVKAVFNIIVQDDRYEKSGIFKAGDIIFFFKGDQSNISRGNRIYYNSNWYEIQETIQHSLQGTTYLQTAKVKPI